MCHVSEAYQQAVMDILQRTNSDKIDIAVDIYRLILQQENQAEALQFFLEEADDAETSQGKQESHCFSDEELESLKEQYDKLVTGIVSNLVSQKLDKQTFYVKLWDVLQNNPLINADNEKEYVFYRVWIDDRIPYFQIDNGLQMDNEMFRDVCRKCRKEIRKVSFVLASPLKQRTETSSLIVKILDSCESEEEKAVVLAQVIAFVERRVLAAVFGKLEDGTEEDEE